MSENKMATNREAAILDVLINGDRAGRDIRNEYESRTKKKLPLGVLYAALTCMETDGFVTSSTGDTKPERQGRPQKFFSITGTGERALNAYQMFVMNAFWGSVQNG